MFVDLLCRFNSVRSIKDVLRLLASVSGFTTEEVCSTMSHLLLLGLVFSSENEDKMKL